MKKILALALSLILVFVMIPISTLADGETYYKVFDASSDTASSQIGKQYNATATIETYAVPTGETDDEGNAITEDRTVLKHQRTETWNGSSIGVTGDFRSVIKGAIGIRFWMAGDPTTFDSGRSVALGLKTSSKHYKTALEHKGNWLPTTEGAAYEWYWNTTSNSVWSVGVDNFDAEYPSTGTAKSLITEEFLSQLKEISFGVDAHSVNLKPCFYIDDVEFIYPEGVTPAPIEFTASFEGTETAILDGAVDPINSDVNNNDAVVMPSATLTSGELAGWATAAEPTTVYAPGETANITGNTTFYAVLKDKPALATPAAPTVLEVAGDYVTLNQVSGAVYSLDGVTWQTSNKFTGLTLGTTYTFYQKLAETLAYRESAASEGLTVTTPYEYIYEAENCSPSGIKTDGSTYTPGKYTGKDDGGYVYTQDNFSKALGYKTVFTVKNLPAGKYMLVTYARNISSRSKYEVTAAKTTSSTAYGTFGTVNFADTTYKFEGRQYHSANYLTGEVLIPEGDFKLVFTNTYAGTTGLCIDSFKFVKVGDYSATYTVTINGEYDSSVEYGQEYTIPTPPEKYNYFDGTNYYVGGEVVTITGDLALTTVGEKITTVYTMDEGSRLAGAGTANLGSDVTQYSYEDMDGNYVLKMLLKGDQYSYIRLPGNWASKDTYVPTNISFKIMKYTASSSIGLKSLDFCSALGDKNIVAGTSKNLVSSLKYLNYDVSVDVTEDLYSLNYFVWQSFVSNTSDGYIYIDNVTITYQYDPNYHPEVEEPTTTTTTTTTTTAPIISDEDGIMYSWEYGTTGLTATGMSSVARSTATSHHGSYSYYLKSNGSVWDQIDKNVTTNTFKSYLKIAVPEDIEILGDVGFYAKAETEVNSSNFESYGVEMADGTYYFRKYANYINHTDWNDLKITGVVLYKLDDSSTTITLGASNFSKDADAATRVANIIYIDGGTSDAKTGTYLDEIYYKYKYDVTVDGVDVGDFNSNLGTEFTLPQNSADGFIAYTDGTDGYEAGSSFTVDKDYEFTTVAVGKVEMLKGAAMRYTDGTGIRFYTDVDTDKINALLTAGYEVTAGTLISPEDLVGGYDLNHKNYQSGYISAVMDVTYDLAKGYYTDDTTPDPCIVGSIVKIQDYNIARNFIGRGYVTVTVGDITKTVYADYADGDVANNTRNIQWIAQQIQNDTNVYPNLEDYKKAIVDKYANYGLETAEEAKI